MTELPEQNALPELVCPHCKKGFRAEAIHGRAARYNGFKCPHCRLFVPAERVLAAAAAPRSGP